MTNPASGEPVAGDGDPAGEAVPGAGAGATAASRAAGLLGVPSPSRDETIHLESDSGRARAAGIYGTVIAAAVIASGGTHFTTMQLEVAIISTLLVYWLAEQYALIIGSHAQGGHFPTRQQILHTFAVSWPMVSASYVPVLVIAIARVFGASEAESSYVALCVVMVLLLIHGYVAGRASEFRGIRLVAITAAGGAIGVLMVLLKVVIVHA